MNTKFYHFTVLFCAVLIILSIKLKAQSNSDKTVTVYIRGIEETKLTLTPFVGARATTPVANVPKVRKGETAKLVIPAKYLPGEFVLRADYISKPGDNPYPSEKILLVFKQDIEIHMNPMYMNNDDSTFFGFGEQENTIYNYFKNENSNKRLQIELLKNFLLNYDNSKSPVFKKGIKEFEKRRKQYNNWLKSQTEMYKDLFVSTLFQFQYIPSVKWQGKPKERTLHLLQNYFEGIDFNDSLLIRTLELDQFMNTYMGLYGSMATSIESRDSLFTLAGRIACEKASQGHPYCYGWMVDYFNDGYTIYKIKDGIEMLKKHIDNPKCMTATKREFTRRIEEMSKLKEGTVAPDFNLKDTKGNDFNFYTFKTNAKYKLLFIWSADCDHCKDKKEKLKAWYDKPDNKNKLDIIAVSLDETETEIPVWEETIKNLPDWIHLRAVGGANSLFAYDYAIIATPVILLIDSKTNIIKSVIKEIEQLDEEINK